MNSYWAVCKINVSRTAISWRGQNSKFPRVASNECFRLCEKFDHSLWIERRGAVNHVMIPHTKSLNHIWAQKFHTHSHRKTYDGGLKACPLWQSCRKLFAYIYVGLVNLAGTMTLFPIIVIPGGPTIFYRICHILSNASSDSEKFSAWTSYPWV